MTVRELIEKLEELPETSKDLPLFFYDDNCEIHSINYVDDFMSDRIDLQTD